MTMLPKTVRFKFPHPALRIQKKTRRLLTNFSLLIANFSFS